MDDAHGSQVSDGTPPATTDSKALALATKRKRVTLSCTNCQKRKVKCDKTRPCSTCRVRDEVSLCEYHDVGDFEPQQPYLVPSDLDRLLQRVADLEEQMARMSGHKVPPFASNASTTDDDQSLTTPDSRVPPLIMSARLGYGRVLKPTPLEKVFRRIDVLSHCSDPTMKEPVLGALPDGSVVQFDQRASSLWPDITASAESSRSQRWTREMHENLAVIPSDEIVLKLVERYFTDTNELLWHILHHKVFRQELDQFLAIRKGGDPLLVDPAWLCILIAVMSVACRAIIEVDVVYGGQTAGVIDMSIATPLSVRLGEAFDSMLLCSGMLEKPQIRLIQALLVMVHLSYLDDEITMFSGAKVEAMDAMWFDTAISICKRLRLHLLGPDWEYPLPQDPALPLNATTYSREVCSRIVHTLAFRDMIKGCTAIDAHGSDYLVFHFPDGSVTTPNPGNFRDDDLWPPTGEEIHPQPPFILTEITALFQLKCMAGFWKSVSSLLCDIPSIGPGTILAMDRRITQEDNDLLSIRQSRDLTDREFIALESLHGSYQKRRLKLHRHFFVRSYEDPTFVFSQAAALTAARSIIKGHRAIAERHGIQVPVSMSLLYHAHHISAIVVLFVHGSVVAKARSDILKEIKRSVELFDMSSSRPGTKFHGVLTHARRLLRYLCTTLETSPPSASEMEDFLGDIHRRLASNIVLMSAGDKDTEMTLPSGSSEPLMSNMYKPDPWVSTAPMDISPSTFDPLIDTSLFGEDWDTVFRDSLFAGF